MDLQTRVAARRAELEKQNRETQRAAAREAEAQQAAERAQRAEALEAIATDLSERGVQVRRRDDELEIVERVLPALNLKELRKTKVNSLLKREARAMWSPGENWQVISLIVAGVFLITFYGLGLLLIFAGMLRRSALNTRYLVEVRNRYSSLEEVEWDDVTPQASND